MKTRNRFLLNPVVTIITLSAHRPLQAVQGVFRQKLFLKSGNYGANHAENLIATRTYLPMNEVLIALIQAKNNGSGFRHSKYQSII